MNDTTELIRTLAQQVISVAQDLLLNAPEAGGSTNVAWIETVLRDVLRQVGAEALSQ